MFFSTPSDYDVNIVFRKVNIVFNQEHSSAYTLLLGSTIIGKEVVLPEIEYAKDKFTYISSESYLVNINIS